MVGVFLSHCHSDKPIVRRIANDLQKNGAIVWIDEAELNVGDSLIQKISEGIDKMDYLAVFLSPESVQSEWVKREVDLAMNQEFKGKRIKVLPLLIKNCELPGFVNGKVFADFRDPAKYDQCLDLILKRLAILPNKMTLTEKTLSNVEGGSAQSIKNKNILYCRRCGEIAGTQSTCTGMYTKHDYVTGNGFIYCSRCGSKVDKKSVCVGTFTHHDFKASTGNVFCRRCGIAAGERSVCIGTYTDHAFVEN